MQRREGLGRVGWKILKLFLYVEGQRLDLLVVMEGGNNNILGLGSRKYDVVESLLVLELGDLDFGFGFVFV